MVDGVCWKAISGCTNCLNQAFYGGDYMKPRIRKHHLTKLEKCGPCANALTAAPTPPPAPKPTEPGKHKMFSSDQREFNFFKYFCDYLRMLHSTPNRKQLGWIFPARVLAFFEFFFDVSQKKLSAAAVCELVFQTFTEVVGLIVPLHIVVCPFAFCLALNYNGPPNPCKKKKARGQTIVGRGTINQQHR